MIELPLFGDGYSSVHVELLGPLVIAVQVAERENQTNTIPYFTIHAWWWDAVRCICASREILYGIETTWAPAISSYRYLGSLT